MIYVLVWIFGRTRRWSDMEWLAGPLGGERDARDGGLVLEFYEHTTTSEIILMRRRDGSARRSMIPAR